MDIPAPGSENPAAAEAHAAVVPQDDVVALAGAIAQQLVEAPEVIGEAPAVVTDTVSLPDMTQEQLADWFGLDNIHNGSQFMSPEDNGRYQELCQTDLKEAIKFLREKWDVYADHAFIESFALVHWVGNSERGLSGLEALIGDGRHEVEISTQGYRDDTSLKDNERWMSAKFGVLIDGRVNLASNEDIQTNQWHNLQEDDATKRRKYTEWANRLMTNQQNCVSPYEFAVGDWKAVGVVVDPDTPDLDQVVALAKKYNLPIVDTQNNHLFTPLAESATV